MATPALIALGSNLGDRTATLDRAVADLAETPGVVVRAASRYHETVPVGGPVGQGSFLNAAAALETTLDPFALLRVLLGIEHRAGRVREARWDARTLDLDLILFGDRIVETPELTVPHPRFAVRRFVLAPLAEVAPDAADPITSSTVLQLLERLDRRPSYLAIDRAADPEIVRLVALDVADRLGARPLLGAPLVIPPRDGVATSIGDRMRYEATIDALGRIEGEARSLGSEFDRARDSGAGSGSWLVSDYVLPREVDRALRLCYDSYEIPDYPVTMAGNHRHLMVRVCEVNEAIRGGPTPTIAVMLGWDRAYADLARLEFGAAMLVPERPDRSGIVAEILAACEASRSGGPP